VQSGSYGLRVREKKVMISHKEDVLRPNDCNE
jgi:hypothetical protein